MADLNIARPQAGQHVAVENVPDARIVLNFPLTEATMEREGDDLVFKFEDGGQVSFTAFYTNYSSETLPTFQIAGEEVAGKDLFAALDSTLMPAAGPAAAAAAPAGGGRYNEFGVDSLMDGVDRMDGLDIGFAGSGVDDTAAVPAAAAAVAPLGAVAAVPAPTPDNGVTFDGLGAAGGDVLANEADIKSGTPTEFKTFTINAPDGLGSLIIGGTSIPLGEEFQATFVPGTYGKLLITGVTDNGDGTFTVQYQYGITGNAQHADGDSTNTDLVDERGPESFTVTVVDGNGTIGNTSLNVGIQDDVPELDAKGDTDIKIVDTAEGTLTLDPGADGADWGTFTVNGKDVTWEAGKGDTFTATVTLPQGSVTLTRPGNDATEISYTFTPAPGMDGGNVNLNFSVKDTDGDLATDSVTVKVTDSDVTFGTGIGAEGGDVIANEKDIAANTDSVTENDVLKGGSFTITAPDGLGSLTIGGTTIPLGDDFKATSIEGKYGDLIINSITGNAKEGYTVNYQYKITDNAQHADGDGQNTDLATGEAAESFDVKVTDGNGTPGSSSLNVTIEDDVPQAEDLHVSGADESVAAGNALSYTVAGTVNLDFGADGPATENPEGAITVTIGGVTLTVGKDITLSAPEPGSTEWGYSFTTDVNPDGKELTFTITDHDRDTSSQSVKIDVDHLVRVDEKSIGHLETHDENTIGGNADTASGSLTFKAPDGFASITVEGQTLTWDGKEWKDGNNNTVTKIANENGPGYLTLGALEGNAESGYTLHYTYTQTDAYTQHGTPSSTEKESEQAESFTLQINDKDGTSAEATINVNIVDDVPTLSATSPEAIRPVDSAEGTLTLNPGADGVDWGTFTVNDKPVEWNESEGTFTATVKLDDGSSSVTLTRPGNAATEISYTFTPAPGMGDGNVHLNFSVKDTDGDPATDSVTVKVKDSEVTFSGKIGAEGGDVTAYEKDIAANTDKPTENDVLTEAKSFTIDAPDGLGSLTIGGELVWQDGKPVENLDPIQGTYGKLLVNVTDNKNGTYTVEYQYKIIDNAEHGIDANEPHNTDIVDERGPESFTVEVVDGNGTLGSSSLNVTIKDDAPELTGTTGETVVVDNGNMPQVPPLDFSSKDGRTFAEVDKTLGAGWRHHDFTLKNGITVTAGHVVYSDKGTGAEVDISKSDFNNPDYILGKAYPGRNDPDHVGLIVSGGRHDELGVDGNGMGSEAVSFDLPGLAYGINLELGLFFQAGSSTDTGNEIARVSFYKDGKLVYTKDLASDKTNGIFNADNEFQDYISGGFDRVVISAVDNGQSDNSDFSIRNISFDTLPNTGTITTGTVTGTSGADGFLLDDADNINYANATFNHADGEHLALKDADGKGFTVELDVQRGSANGSGLITAYILDENGNRTGDMAFSAVLDAEGNWTFQQYMPFTSADGGSDNNKDTFDLSFITKDTDGDEAVWHANINTNTHEEPKPHPTDGDDTFVVTWGDGHITDVKADGLGIHDNPGDKHPIQNSYDAGNGEDTLILKGAAGNAIYVDKNGIIHLDGDPHGSDGTAFMNFEHVVGKNDNHDKYTLKLADDMHYSVDEDGTVTVYYGDEGKSITFDCIQNPENPGSITGGTPLTDPLHLSSLNSLLDEQGDKLLFGDLDSSLSAPLHAHADNSVFSFDPHGSYLDDSGEDMDILLGGMGDLTHMQDMLANGAITNVEILVAGDNVPQLTDMQAVCDKLGIALDDGKVSLDGWTPDVGSTGQHITVTDQHGIEYQQFSHDDVTILVQQQVIKSDSGAV